MQDDITYSPIIHQDSTIISFGVPALWYTFTGNLLEILLGSCSFCLPESLRDILHGDKSLLWERCSEQVGPCVINSPKVSCNQKKKKQKKRQIDTRVQQGH